jgi:hypothetical protein
MTVLEWLLSGDPAVKRLTMKYLLGQDDTYTDAGWIEAYITRFDPAEKRWGQGIYGPKWISTFYTMRDLCHLEIDPNHPIYQQGLDTLLQHMWNPAIKVETDICVVAMLACLVMHGRRQGRQLDEMMHYLLRNQQPDGGWNCSSLSGGTSKSSIHTTLSVLEAFAAYQSFGRETHLSGTREQTKGGQEYLLRKHLFRRETDQSMIVPYITQFHFPPRWKYDLLRALHYFASIQHPLAPRMEEGLSILRDKIRRGYLNKGTSHSGRLHFRLEEGRFGRMNTLRGLIVLKHYDFAYFRQLLALPMSGEAR